MASIQIQAFKKRAFLRQVCLGAIHTTSTIEAALTAVQTQCNSPSFQKGRIVVSQSGSGQSGSFQMGLAGSEWTQDNIFGLTEELISLLYTVLYNGSTTVQDDGTPASTNALRAAMFEDDSLQGISRQQGDWTGLNVPSIGGVMGT